MLLFQSNESVRIRGTKDHCAPLVLICNRGLFETSFDFRHVVIWKETRELLFQVQLPIEAVRGEGFQDS